MFFIPELPGHFLSPNELEDHYLAVHQNAFPQNLLSPTFSFLPGKVDTKDLSEHICPNCMYDHYHRVALLS